MTDVNDLYEPGDDREPEPPDPEPPLSLEEIQQFLQIAQGLALPEGAVVSPGELEVVEDAKRILLSQALPQLLAEHAEWHAIPMSVEYALTEGEEPGPDAQLLSEAQIAKAEGIPGAVVWTRVVRRNGWWRVSSEPPF